MKKLLHIIATPRADASRTLQVTEVFLDSFRKKYPQCKVDTLNVFTEGLPSLTVKMISGKYVLLGGGELSPDLEKAWKDIVAHIERFLSADAYLISTPMWNFSIPYPLKQYIDIIVQPKYLFKYTEKGPEGLVKNRKAVIITSRGGDYGPESPFHAFDHQEPYLRSILGFVGITDITFINAQPMDALGLDIQRQRIEEAMIVARKIAQNF